MVDQRWWDRINELEDRSTELPSLSNKILWNNNKRADICIAGVPEREERVNGTGKVFKEIIADNFPNLIKDKPTDSIS